MFATAISSSMGRPALNADGTRRIDGDRRPVALAPGTFVVDLDEAEAALGEPAGSVPVDELRRLAGLFRGDLLEGLDLLDSFRFHSWCTGQRERARGRRLKVLTSLIERTDDVGEALEHAHVLVALDPLGEDANLRAIRMLVQIRRHQDAQAQAASYRRTLEIELGAVPADVARRIRKVVHADPAPRAVPAATVAQVTSVIGPATAGPDYVPPRT